MTNQSKSDREAERLRNRQIMQETDPDMLKFIDEMKAAFPEMRVYDMHCLVPRKDDKG